MRIGNKIIYVILKILIAIFYFKKIEFKNKLIIMHIYAYNQATQSTPNQTHRLKT